MHSQTTGSQPINESVSWLLTRAELVWQTSTHRINHAFPTVPCSTNVIEEHPTKFTGCRARENIKRVTVTMYSTKVQYSHQKCPSLSLNPLPCMNPESIPGPSAKSYCFYTVTDNRTKFSIDSSLQVSQRSVRYQTFCGGAKPCAALPATNGKADETDRHFASLSEPPRGSPKAYTDLCA